MENGIESIGIHNHATIMATCDKYTKHAINKYGHEIRQ